ncbi:hypothetical protein [Streptomyces sp. NPDC088246]|uniref:hypothetical protein n=1 Tax=Streptomyces sp. NPDC088246 TaxID=3365842 RepID=UPI003815B048
MALAAFAPQGLGVLVQVVLVQGSAGRAVLGAQAGCLCGDLSVGLEQLIACGVEPTGHGVSDEHNMPVEDEPRHVRDDLHAFTNRCDA